MKVSKVFKNCIKSLLPIGIMLLMISCGQKVFDTKEELIAHINDPENGYTQEKSINGIDFSISYRPTDILVKQELQTDASQEVIDSVRKKYNKQIYINVSLSKNNEEILNSMGTSRNDFGAMVKQLAFGMGDKVHLFTQTKDTVELLDFIYPRAYGMGGATNIMFVYRREEVVPQGDFCHLTIEDIGLRTGEIGFKIPIEPINNEPKLKFE